MASSGPEDSGGVSPSSIDKRRNKLGYQRISVACGHCRRRKIRCAPAESDPQGRCSNCIRLKKECVFSPVDTAGPAGPEGRPQGSQGLSSKPSAILTPSPSSMGAPSLDGPDSELQRFATIPSNISPDHQLSMEPTSAVSASSAGSLGHPEMGYHPAFAPGSATRPDWQARSFSGPNQPYADPHWRVRDASTADSYGRLGAPAGYAYPQQPGTPVYGQPLRSASWTDASQHQSPYPAHYSSPLPHASSQAPVIVYPQAYVPGNDPRAHAPSPSHYSQASGSYPPTTYAGQQEQWGSYATNADFVDPSRHDSAASWGSGMQHMHGMDAQYHMHPAGGADVYKRGGSHPGGPDPYRRGNNHPG